jgi:hypothetical protein
LEFSSNINCVQPLDVMKGRGLRSS